MKLAQRRKMDAFVAFIANRRRVLRAQRSLRADRVPAAVRVLHDRMSYVFSAPHLVIDAYQDALPTASDLLSYANFTLNFTAFVAGPIQLYGDYRRAESATPRRSTCRPPARAERS